MKIALCKVCRWLGPIVWDTLYLSFWVTQYWSWIMIIFYCWSPFRLIQLFFFINYLPTYKKNLPSAQHIHNLYAQILPCQWAIFRCLYYIYLVTMKLFVIFLIIIFKSAKAEDKKGLIRGVLIQSCSARAKNFTNYVFCHLQFSGVIQNI